jgi:hypothetical protein
MSILLASSSDQLTNKSDCNLDGKEKRVNSDRRLFLPYRSEFVIPSSLLILRFVSHSNGVTIRVCAGGRAGDDCNRRSSGTQ